MYSGSCHCGRITFDVEGEFAEVKECNCSHCSRKGYLLWLVAREQRRLKSGEGEYAAYQFNRHVISHHFCPICGCAPFATANAPSGKPTAAINVRCLEGVDLGSVKRVAVNGRSF